MIYRQLLLLPKVALEQAFRRLLHHLLFLCVHAGQLSRYHPRSLFYMYMYMYGLLQLHLETVKLLREEVQMSKLMKVSNILRAGKVPIDGMTILGSVSYFCVCDR